VDLYNEVISYTQGMVGLLTEKLRLLFENFQLSTVQLNDLTRVSAENERHTTEKARLLLGNFAKDP